MNGVASLSHPIRSLHKLILPKATVLSLLTSHTGHHTHEISTTNMAQPWTKERLLDHFERGRQRAQAEGDQSTALVKKLWTQGLQEDPRFLELYLRYYNLRQNHQTMTLEDDFELKTLGHMLLLCKKPEEKPDQDSRLLDLPPELRNRIYEYALVESEGVEISKRKLKGAMALLQTCSQIKKEASSICKYSITNLQSSTSTNMTIVFAENAFNFNITHKNWRALISWLHLHGDHTARIQSICLTYTLTVREDASVWAAAKGTMMVSGCHATGALLSQVNHTCNLFFANLGKTKVPAKNITAPVPGEMPILEKKEECMLAQVTKLWSRRVEAKKSG